MNPPTRFQHKVYEMVKLVPVGRVTTYKLLADAINCRSPRAVGQALRVNPYAPEVPCHRVIRSDFSLGGFYGSTGLEAQKIKQSILKDEGVYFEKGILLEKKQLFNFAKRY